MIGLLKIHFCCIGRQNLRRGDVRKEKKRGRAVPGKFQC